jgi:hypothetical protein
MSFRYLLYSVLVGASLAADGIPSLAQTPTHTPPAGMTCQGDRIVWVNIPSHIYHFEGERYFGSTKNGKFMCQQAADKEGDRPTRNGP